MNSQTRNRHTLLSSKYYNMSLSVRVKILHSRIVSVVRTVADQLNLFFFSKYFFYSINFCTLLQSLETIFKLTNLFNIVQHKHPIFYHFFLNETVYERITQYFKTSFFLAGNKFLGIFYRCLFIWPGIEKNKYLFII